MVYRIEMRNGELMIGQRFSGWRKLLPKGQDHFDTEPGPSVPVASTIVFTRDSASVVNGMKISGGRARNLQFIRVSLPNLKSR